MPKQLSQMMLHAIHLVFFFFLNTSHAQLSLSHTKQTFCPFTCTIGHMNNSIFLGSLNMIQPYELCLHWNHNKYQVIAYQTNIRRHSSRDEYRGEYCNQLYILFFLIFQNWTLFLNLRCGTSHASVSLAFS